MTIMPVPGSFRIVAQIQTLVFETRMPPPYLARAKAVPLAYNSLRQPLRAKYDMLSLGSFAAPAVIAPVRIENQRRTRKSAAVCTLAALPQRRSGCNS